MLEQARLDTHDKRDTLVTTCIWTLLCVDQIQVPISQQDPRVDYADRRRLRDNDEYKVFIHLIHLFDYRFQ